MRIIKCCSIILNYNSVDYTKELTLNLQKIDEIDKIVIVDNDSVDNSFMKLKQFFRSFEGVFVIKTNKNLGYSYGNNYGAKFILKHFEAEYILISNPDVEIPKNFVKNMMNYLENDSKLAAVSGLMLNYKKEIIASQIAWQIPNLLSYAIMNLEVLVKIYNPIKYKNLDLNGNNNNLTYVDCLPGSCFVIRSDILEKIGFFDDNIFLYCEEVVLAKKIKDLGFINGLSFDDFFVHKHFKKRSLKTEMGYYVRLYKSRLYFIIHYTKFGKILSPLFLLSIILGLIEKIVILNLGIIIKHFKGKTND